jgi:hypothetical protein
MRDVDEVTGQIVDAAYKLHTGLGPGLLESRSIPNSFSLTCA